MKRTISVALAAVGLIAVSTTAFSDGHLGHGKAVKARQAHMQIYSWNLGNIAAMIKGEAKYDAEAAKNFADNLATAAAMKNGAMWPAGSDNEAMPGKTDALKKIWTTYPAIAEKSKALVDASAAMAKTAGDGVDALKASIGAVGKSCKGCHEDYRAPKS